jgi:hypothetical protein
MNVDFNQLSKSCSAATQGTNINETIVISETYDFFYTSLTPSSLQFARPTHVDHFHPFSAKNPMISQFCSARTERV